MKIEYKKRTGTKEKLVTLRQKQIKMLQQKRKIYILSKEAKQWHLEQI